MRGLLLFFISFTLLSYADIQVLIKKYQEGKYKYVCLHGYKLFQELKKDENLINMYAFSCLKSDYINRLAVPILLLGKTPQSRQNRAYFSLILAQKNLLISALSDNMQFNNLSVPNTDFIISKIFNLYFQKKFKKSDNIFIMKDPQKTDHSYKVYVIKKHSIPYLHIDEYVNNKIVKKHIYR